MRFLGLDLNDRVLDAKTIWLFWERLTGAGAMKKLFASFEVALQDRGYKPVGGQIVDALLIAAPRALDRKKKRNVPRQAKMQRISGLTILRRRPKKTQNARWMVKYSKARKTKDGGEDAGRVDISVPHFGYKNHISIDRK